MHDPKKPATPPPAAATSPEPPSPDGLPLDRAYPRFDAIARGRNHGHSPAAHRSVIERLQSNRRRAELLGWTAFLLARTGGSGRLELRGIPPTGHDRELVPDAIPDSSGQSAPGSSAANDVLHDDGGR